MKLYCNNHKEKQYKFKTVSLPDKSKIKTVYDEFSLKNIASYRCVECNKIYNIYDKAFEVNNN